MRLLSVTNATEAGWHQGDSGWAWAGCTKGGGGGLPPFHCIPDGGLWGRRGGPPRGVWSLCRALRRLERLPHHKAPERTPSPLCPGPRSRDHQTQCARALFTGERHREGAEGPRASGWTAIGALRAVLNRCTCPERPVTTQGQRRPSSGRSRSVVHEKVIAGVRGRGTLRPPLSWGCTGRKVVPDSGKGKTAGAHQRQPGGGRLDGGRRRLDGGRWRLTGGRRLLEGGWRRLEGGRQRLEGGWRRLEGGRRRLEGGGQRLVGGRWRMKSGRRRLEHGRRRLECGRRQLGGGGWRLDGGGLLVDSGRRRLEDGPPLSRAAGPGTNLTRVQNVKCLRGARGGITVRQWGRAAQTGRATARESARQVREKRKT